MKRLLTDEADLRLVLDLARHCADKDRVIGDRNDFGLARTVLESALGEIEREGSPPNTSHAERELTLEYARAWLDDPEVHPWRRTERAWEVIRERYPDVATSGDAEALVLTGRIHRRRWEQSAQSRDLQRAIYFFQLAFNAEESGDPYHRGIGGYQAALLMVELARLEERAVFYLDRETDYSTRMPTIYEFSRTDRIKRYVEHLSDGLTARHLREAADRTMRRTTDVLSSLAEGDGQSVWQVNAAAAAANFGLRRYGVALEFARRAAGCPAPNDHELQSWAQEFAIMARQRGIRPESHSVGQAVRRGDGALLGIRPEPSKTAEEALDRRLAGESIQDVATDLFDSVEEAESAVLQAEQKRVFDVVEALVANIRTDTVLNTFAGKVGLALSGGGFRASLYHVGVLAALADLHLLRHVQVISSVSGGSITAAYYYLLLKRLLSSGPDGDPERPIEDSDYVALVDRLCDGMIDAAGCDLRARLVSNFFDNFRLLLNYSPSMRLGDLIERLVLPAVDGGDDNNTSPHTLLSDLAINPLPESPDAGVDPVGEFKPRRHNWTRSSKVPILVMNATALNTGHNWQLTVHHMGEPPAMVHPEIDANPRLRRIYFDKTARALSVRAAVEGRGPLAARASSLVRKGADWMGFQPALSGSEAEQLLSESGVTPEELARLQDKLEQVLSEGGEDRTIDVPALRLGRAVAASAAVPGLFEPLPIEQRGTTMTVKLSDGGVVDNQGTTGLTEQGCNVLLVSDAAGQLTSVPEPAGGLFPALRSNLISLQRIRSAQYEELKTRRRAQQIRDFMFVHLTMGLDSKPIRWVTDTGGIDLWPPTWTRAMEGSPREQTGITAYGVDRRVQAMLADMRTDLDSFSEVEGHALMTSGYLATRHQIGVGIGPFRFGDSQEEVEEAFPAHDWAFLDIAKAIGAPADPKNDGQLARVQKRVRNHLDRSSRRLFRWLPTPVVGAFAFGLLLLVLYLVSGALTSPEPLVELGALRLALWIALGSTSFVLLMAFLRGVRLSLVAAGWKVFLAALSMVLMLLSWPYLLFRRLFPKARRGRIERYVREDS